MLLTLRRTYQPTQTIGKLTGGGLDLCTIELVWDDNKSRKSCIPEGTYKATPRTSQKYGKHFLINGVQGRDLILVHAANYARELLGCIGVGLSHADIDKDGKPDVTSSKKAMEILLSKFPSGFELKIS